MPRTLIIGIGNLVLQDEGFGLHAIKQIDADALPPHVDIADGGTAGLHLMGLLQNYDKIIVLDAALDNNPPGTVRMLQPKFGEFPPLITAHEIGLKDTLEALELTGFKPDVTLIVCSVRRFTSLGAELSAEVASAIPHAVEMALEAAGVTACSCARDSR